MADKPRLLVTGASGHVGGAIAAHMSTVGWEVVGLSRRGPLEADISSPGFLTQMVTTQPCDAVVHAAANLDKRLFEPGVSAVNCVGTQNVYALAQHWKVRKVIYISGITVIGLPQILPIDEEHPLKPLTAYHTSKLYGEFLLGALSMPSVALRVSAPVGPGMPPGRILSVFVQRALRGQPLLLSGRGSRQQDFVDVRDVARAVELSLTKEVTGIFNIGSGKSISNLELARKCMSELSAHSIRLTGTDDPEEKVIWQVSIEKAKKALGYKPKYSIEESIHALAESYASCIS